MLEVECSGRETRSPGHTLTHNNTSLIQLSNYPVRRRGTVSRSRPCGPTLRPNDTLPLTPSPASKPYPFPLYAVPRSLSLTVNCHPARVKTLTRGYDCRLPIDEAMVTE